MSEIDRTVSERMGTKLPSFDPNNDSISIPSGRPIVHEIISNDHCVFTSFDIETGGELCGIVQILAELCQFELGADGGASVAKAVTKYIERSPLVFNTFGPTLSSTNETDRLCVKI